MTYQQTSLFAFNEVKPHLGQMQAKVYKEIVLHPGIDNLGIAQRLSMPINSVTPRVKELREMRRVREAGKQMNSETGRPTMRWEVCR